MKQLLWISILAALFIPFQGNNFTIGTCQHTCVNMIENDYQCKKNPMWDQFPDMGCLFFVQTEIPKPSNLLDQIQIWEIHLYTDIYYHSLDQYIFSILLLELAMFFFCYQLVQIERTHSQLLQQYQQLHQIVRAGFHIDQAPTIHQQITAIKTATINLQVKNHPFFEELRNIQRQFKQKMKSQQFQMWLQIFKTSHKRDKRKAHKLKKRGIAIPVTETKQKIFPWSQYYCSKSLLEEQCPICLSGGVNIQNLRCEHLFHYTCLAEWQRYRNRCPTCRDWLEQPFLLICGRCRLKSVLVDLNELNLSFSDYCPQCLEALQ